MAELPEHISVIKNDLDTIFIYAESFPRVIARGNTLVVWTQINWPTVRQNKLSDSGSDQKV